jgi:hypothetical protein
MVGLHGPGELLRDLDSSDTRLVLPRRLDECGTSLNQTTWNGFFGDVVTNRLSDPGSVANSLATMSEYQDSANGGAADGAHRNSPESLAEIHQLSPRRLGSVMGHARWRHLPLSRALNAVVGARIGPGAADLAAHGVVCRRRLNTDPLSPP